MPEPVPRPTAILVRHRRPIRNRHHRLRLHHRMQRRPPLDPPERLQSLIQIHPPLRLQIMRPRLRLHYRLPEIVQQQPIRQPLPARMPLLRPEQQGPPRHPARWPRRQAPEHHRRRNLPQRRKHRRTHRRHTHPRRPHRKIRHASRHQRRQMPIVRPVAVRPIRSRSHPIVKIPALLRPLTPLPVPIRCRLPRHAKPTDIPPNLSRTLRTSTHPRLPQRMRLRHPSPLRMRLKNPHLTRLTINPIPHRHHPVIPMPHHQRLHHITLTNQRHAAPRRRQHPLGHSRCPRSRRQGRHVHHSPLRSPDRRKLQPDHLHQIPPPRRPAPRTPRMIIHRQLEPPPRILR